MIANGAHAPSWTVVLRPDGVVDDVQGAPIHWLGRLLSESGDVPEEVQAAAMEWLFERDPSTGRPIGLALAMVKDVVLAHRGSIDVGARPRGGTSITLRIPRPTER